MENIKRRYKRDLLLRLLNDDVGSLNIAEFSKTLNIKDAVLMSAKSWDEVDVSSIAKSWNKLLKCTDESDRNSDGARDDVDVDSLLNDMEVPSEEKIMEWLRADEGDPGYQEFTEEEIISIAREENEGALTNEDADDDNEIIPPTVSHATACQSIQTLLTYLEQQPTAPMGTIVLLNGLLMETAQKRVISQRRKKLMITLLSYNPPNTCIVYCVKYMYIIYVCKHGVIL